MVDVGDGVEDGVGCEAAGVFAGVGVSAGVFGPAGGEDCGGRDVATLTDTRTMETNTNKARSMVTLER